MQTLKFILSDFWIFLGFIVILSMILRFLIIIWNRFWRHFTLMKHGYPPDHCDADGDFENKQKDYSTD